MRLGDGKVCTPYAHNRTQAFIRHLQKGHAANQKLVLAVSGRSAQAKSQRAEALVKASRSTPPLMRRGLGRPVKTCGPLHGQGELIYIEPTPCYGPRPGPVLPMNVRHNGPRPCPARRYFRLWGSARPGPIRSITVSNTHGPARRAFTIF